MVVERSRRVPFLRSKTHQRQSDRQNGVGINGPTVDKLRQSHQPAQVPETAMSKNLWSALLGELGGYGAWRSDDQAFAQVAQRLNRFDMGAELSVEQVDLILFSLSRGQALMRAVHDWEDPIVGAKPKTAQSSSHFRGAQWRLVMAYNAFEIVCFALMAGKYASAQQRFSEFAVCCEMSLYQDRIGLPNQGLATTQQWFDASMAETGSKEAYLSGFLGLENGDRKVFQAWFVDAQAIETWEGAVLLAKALRNMTAHGALSATKTKELGLKAAMEEATEILRQLVLGAIARLARHDEP